jgi:hypothetical protein
MIADCELSIADFKWIAIQFQFFKRSLPFENQIPEFQIQKLIVDKSEAPHLKQYCRGYCW